MKSIVVAEKRHREKIMKFKPISCPILKNYAEMLEDYELLSVALERWEHYDPDQVITEEEMERRLGITQEELDSVGEVEFE